MKNTSGDNFGAVAKCRLYRSVYEILHPTISKMNISNYKVVFDEKLLPVLVFYPKRISNIDSVFIYIPSDGMVNDSYGKYTDICKRLAKETNSIVIAIDYLELSVKFSSVVSKISKLIKFLYEELEKSNIVFENIVLISDSVGCKIMGIVVKKLINKNVNIKKLVMLYPVVRDDYSEYCWDDTLVNVNFNLNKRVNLYLERYFPKTSGVNYDLSELIYFKNFPKTLIVTGDMDIFKYDGKLLSECLCKNVKGSKYANIKFACHGFLASEDEDVKAETYKIIEEFVL